MTYFGFLLRFLVIPILIFLGVTYWDNRNHRQIKDFRNGWAVWIAIAIHIVLAVIYTTPWDNYLVATGVWYYNPSLVTGKVIGYVPIEEYTFFVLETILSGLWWWFLARHLSPPKTGFKQNKGLVYLATCVLALLWLVSTYLFFFGAEKWTYLSIILFWALPAILPQLLFGADILWHYRKLVFWGIFCPGTVSLIDGHRRLDRYDLVHFKNADNRHPVLRDPATGRGSLLFHHQHFDRERHDSPAGKRQPGKICHDQANHRKMEKSWTRN